MGHLTALKDLRQKGFVIPGSDGTVNLGAYSEAAEKLWRKARADAKAAKTKEAPGSPPPGVHPASTHRSGIFSSSAALASSPRGSRQRGVQGHGDSPQPFRRSPVRAPPGG